MSRPAVLWCALALLAGTLPAASLQIGPNITFSDLGPIARATMQVLAPARGRAVGR